MKQILLAAAGLLLVLLLLRDSPGPPPVQVNRLALGTLVTVKLYQDEAQAKPLIERALAEVDRIDSLMSRYIPTSEANQIGRTAVSAPVTCSPEMARVLKRSQHFAAMTGGLFDVTIGSLTRLWNFPDVTVPPAADRIDSALALVDYRALELQGNQVRISRPGIRLDLGGSAKGFAVDRAVELLQELGADCGLIEAGGDIRYWGEKPDGSAWRFGIQHPRDRSGYIEVDDIGLAAIATSGDYEQFFEYEGRRYHHILDPKTGYPAMRAISATAWTSNALDADILSTTLFILGPGKGISFIESVADAEGLIFFEDGGRLRHIASSGVADRLHFSEVEN